MSSDPRHPLTALLGAVVPRPVLVLIVVLVMGGAAAWLLLPRGGSRPLILRSQPAGTQPATEGFLLSPAEAMGDDHWRLSWSKVEGADAYQVKFFTPQLDELAHVEPVPVLSIVVTRDQLGASVAGDRKIVLWRVAALRDGDVIATSPVGTIPLR